MSQTASVLSPLKIGKYVSRYPIIQGAMAVRVSGANLAAAVANAGGIGVISSLGLGLDAPSFRPRRGNFFPANRQALVDELTTARALSPDGVIGVNILVATRDYPAMAQTAAAYGADLIITGAGLPLDLPAYTADYPDVALVPIVSNLEDARMLCQTWQQRYGRLPDALIVENCRAVGGHFNQCEQIDPAALGVEWVIAQVKTYVEQLNANIPLIATGGIWERSDIDRMLELGAAGVQMGTRFITTEECDADPRYKEHYLNIDAADIVTVPSPVGKPGRALRNAFAEKAIAGSRKLEQRCIANCLSTCLCRSTRKTYCILQALAIAARGDVENGLIFSGGNVRPVARIMPVAELMAELTQPQRAIGSPYEVESKCYAGG